MKKENYIKEKELTKYPKSITFEVLKILSTIMETHICKIEYKDDSQMVLDFFCNSI